ncbi:MAG: CRISPR-associated ring nuclease, partial [Anaerolineae bacterium]
MLDARLLQHPRQVARQDRFSGVWWPANQNGRETLAGSVHQKHLWRIVKMSANQKSVMLATLGGQPQIITFALDALLARGETIREVIVLYLSAEGSRVNRAMARLTAEFVDDSYAGRPCRLRPMPVRDDLRRLPDIETETDAQITQKMLQELMISLKSENYHLHACVSGGRRIMALLIMSVALIHFDYRDKLWHVYTPNELQERAWEGAIMHARSTEGVHLIQVPVVPLGTHFPALRQLAQTSIGELIRPEPGWPNEAEKDRCKSVIEYLTRRELEALKAFAAGLSIQDVADQMVISPNTVNTYKKKILELCRNAWPERQTLRYFHLRELFGPYFEV